MSCGNNMQFVNKITKMLSLFVVYILVYRKPFHYLVLSELTHGNTKKIVLTGFSITCFNSGNDGFKQNSLPQLYTYLTLLTGKNLCLTEFRVQKFIEIHSWLLLTFFMFTQSIKFI